MILSFGGRERDWGSSVEWLMCQILTHTPNQHSPFPNGIKGYRKKETPPFFEALWGLFLMEIKGYFWGSWDDARDDKIRHTRRGQHDRDKRIGLKKVSL